MGKKQQEHESFCLGYIERNVHTREELAAIRSSFGDAAHLVDAIAADLTEGMRLSKRRSEIEALAKQFADAIWDLRKRVHVPEKSAGGPHAD